MITNQYKLNTESYAKQKKWVIVLYVQSNVELGTWNV